MNWNPPTSVLLDRLREARGWKCERCNEKGTRRGQHPGLEFAHKRPTKLSEIPRGRGSRVRYLDIKANPDAYELLCKRCHAASDLKVLTNRAKAEAAAPGLDHGDTHVAGTAQPPGAYQDEVPF